MAVSGLCELVLIVADVPASATFYREIVGLTPETEPNESWAWFWSGIPEQSARLALHRGALLFEEHSPLPTGERWGRTHFAFRVEKADLDSALDRVRSAGVPLYGPIDQGWMDARSHYFYDLDGNQLEWWTPNG